MDEDSIRWRHRSDGVLLVNRLYIKEVKELQGGKIGPWNQIWKTKNNFERKKQELLASQSASTAEGETNSAGQPSQLIKMDIWVQSVGGKKKRRVKGLGSLGRSVKASSKQSTSALLRETDEMIKAQVNASNADLYAQL